MGKHGGAGKHRGEPKTGLSGAFFGKGSRKVSKRDNFDNKETDEKKDEK